MKKFRFLTLIISCLLVLSSCSKQESVERGYWDGVSASGASVTDGDCPILLEGVSVTLDISEFPYLGRDSAEKHLAYTGRVTTEYRFYNPTDEAVTAAMAFPLGKDPVYAPTDGDGNAVSDLQKYSVTLSGKTVTPELRHSVHSGYQTWTRHDVEYSSVMDEFAVYDFYYPEAPVTVSTYVVSGVDEENYPEAFAILEIPLPSENVGSLFVPDQTLARSSSGYIRKGLPAKNGRTVTVYNIGVETDELPEWKIYSDHLIQEAEQIAGVLTLTDKRTITFFDLAMSEWSAESGVRDVDWYNAIALEFSRNNGQRVLDISDNLTPYYLYEITLAPGERAVNTLAAPIYPRANTKFSPAIYTYDYLLPNFGTDESFEGLDVTVNTPFCVVEKDYGILLNYSLFSMPNSYESEVTDSGYGYKIEPSPRLYGFTISLSESAEPEFNSALVDVIVYLALAAIFYYIVVPIGIITLIAVAVAIIVKELKKKKAKKEDEDA